MIRNLALQFDAPNIPPTVAIAAPSIAWSATLERELSQCKTAWFASVGQLCETVAAEHFDVAVLELGSQLATDAAVAISELGRSSHGTMLVAVGSSLLERYDQSQAAELINAIGVVAWFPHLSGAARIMSVIERWSTSRPRAERANLSIEQLVAAQLPWQPVV